MENNGTIWVNVSIFFNLNDWSRLIADGITPYCISMRQQEWLINYILYLNRERGENIRVSFHVKQDKAKDFLLETDRYFKYYLASNPSCARLNNNKILNFISDFPENSIFYKLYSSFENGLPGRCKGVMQSFQSEYSNLWHTAFLNEPFDDETVTVFFMYSVISLLYSPDISEINFIHLLLRLKDNYEQMFDDNRKKIVHEILKSKKAELLELAEEVFYPKINDNNFIWLSEFQDSCSSYYKELEHYTEDFDIENATKWAINKISDQLNIEVLKAGELVLLSLEAILLVVNKKEEKQIMISY